MGKPVDPLGHDPAEREDVLLKLGELEVPEDEFFGLDNKGMKLALKRWLYGEQAGCRY